MHSSSLALSLAAFQQASAVSPAYLLAVSGLTVLCIGSPACWLTALGLASPFGKPRKPPLSCSHPCSWGMGWVPLCLREMEMKDEMEDSNLILQAQPSILFGGIHTKKEYGMG